MGKTLSRLLAVLVILSPHGVAGAPAGFPHILPTTVPFLSEALPPAPLHHLALPLEDPAPKVIAARLESPPPAAPEPEELQDLTRSEGLEMDMIEYANEQDTLRFEARRRRFEEKTGGRAIVYAVHPGTRWEDVPILSGDALDQALAEIIERIPARWAYNRLVADKVLTMVVFAAGPAQGAKGVFTIKTGFDPKHEGAPQPVLRINMLGPLGYVQFFTAMGGGKENYMPAWHHDHSGSYMDIPLDRDLRGENAPEGPPELVERFVGSAAGSSAVLELIQMPGGPLAIRKASTAPGAGEKLLAEGRYLQELRRRGLPWFPEVYSIEQEGDRVTLVEENLRGFPAAEFLIWNFGEPFYSIRPEALWALVQHVFKSFIPGLYSQRAGPTPADFAHRRIERAGQLLAEAAAQAPALQELFSAPVFRFMEDGEQIIPGFETLVPFLKGLAATGIFNPPHLVQTHGDPALPNILIDPMDYLRNHGRFKNFRTTDVIPRPDGDDYLDDLAKLIHAFYGNYTVAKMDGVFQLFRGDRDFADGIVSLYADIDDEANPTSLDMSSRLTRLFLSWLADTTDLFGLEQGEAWKYRLLFTHAMAVARLPVHQVRHDGRESPGMLLYLTAMMQLEALVNNLLCGPLPNIPGFVRPQGLVRAWEILKKTPPSVLLSRSV